MGDGLPSQKNNSNSGLTTLHLIGTTAPPLWLEMTELPERLQRGEESMANAIRSGPACWGVRGRLQGQSKMPG